MFGIVYTLASFIGTGISGVKATIEDLQCEARGFKRLKDGENENNTYYDRKGNQRDLLTNRIVEEIVFHKSDLGKYGYLNGDFSGCIEGDVIIVDNLNHSLVRNISKNKRNQLMKERNDDVTVIDGGINGIKDTGGYTDDKKGHRYIDVVTNDTYLCRDFPVAFRENQNKHISPVWCRYYMSEQTGLIVRIADSQKEFEKRYREKNWNHMIPTESEKDKFIKEFNELQKIGGWMKNKYDELNKQNKYTELRYIKFNKYNYKSHPNAYYFCNEFDVMDKLLVD